MWAARASDENGPMVLAFHDGWVFWASSDNRGSQIPHPHSYWVRGRSKYKLLLEQEPLLRTVWQIGQRRLQALALRTNHLSNSCTLLFVLSTDWWISTSKTPLFQASTEEGLALGGRWWLVSPDLFKELQKIALRSRGEIKIELLLLSVWNPSHEKNPAYTVEFGLWLLADD